MALAASGASQTERGRQLRSSQRIMDPAKTIKSFDLAAGLGRVVLFDWEGYENIKDRDRNLVCFRSDGTERWRPSASGITRYPQDFFTGVRMTGSFLQASTWSDYFVWIDPETGWVVNWLGK